nr:family 43 glycosylhydrolase [Domibacillus tundrae]
MTDIINPILPGFHPDPSIIRVEDNYYIATSTFEWFPGVQLFHSKDLVHWRQLPAPLMRESQINMVGDIDSGGVWAPCLSYSDGLFYLIYTDVKSRMGAFKDTHNYMVTAENIEGPWSEPVYLNSSGFDPSLFHEEDGTKWLVNMIWDFRKGKNSFAGIALQEYSVQEKKLIGPVKNIFKGSKLGLTEAPHIYKRNGYYYLLTAEGGTWYTHAVTVARSQSLAGPYELDPANPILTSNEEEKQQLQKAGHGSLVETQNGDWYMAHLCGRPVVGKKCILGRETALQKCYWTDDGWLRIQGGPNPQTIVEAPSLPPHPFEQESNKDDFTGETLKHYWSSLRRTFTDEWISLSDRPGYLRLTGGESMQSSSLFTVKAFWPED